MKYLIHVPVEQYGFVSEELEGTVEDAAAAYKSLSGAFKGGIGLPDSDFNTFTDRYLQGEKLNSEDLEAYEEMSLEQKSHIQWAKRSKARIKAKTNKQ